ncbi:MAG TPA: hypothetical protein VKT29_07735 [Terriglobales bacterium]|nr:hypothetical protein [Terriglobales bacterium]
MSGRVWTGSIIIIIVLGAIVSFGYGRPGNATLLSRHSMPAQELPNRVVAVTAQGKLFHDPTCRYIHGKPEMISAREAADRGYTPCPRCLGKYLRR